MSTGEIDTQGSDEHVTDFVIKEENLTDGEDVDWDDDGDDRESRSQHVPSTGYKDTEDAVVGFNIYKDIKLKVLHYLYHRK